MRWQTVPASVLAPYAALAGKPSRPLSGGLINDTFLVEGEEAAVVQRLHPIFEGRVNEDIDVVTRHLVARGIPTPRLIRTDAGAAFVEHEGRPWRALTFVEGKTFHRIDEPALAQAAGALVARFHVAVADLDHDYHFSRGNVHDTPRHLAHLRTALSTYPDHPLFERVAPLADTLFAAAEGLPDLSGLPQHHSHGDLKISNLLFEQSGDGLCLVDLDTLCRMSFAFEMGDALRSWCNPGGEDQGQVRFDLVRFAAALDGYAPVARPLRSREEIDTLVDGVRTICLELTARFLTDALCESYFGWDAARFSSRGAHNWVRAQSQWALYQSVTMQHAEAERCVTRAFMG